MLKKYKNFINEINKILKINQNKSVDSQSELKSFVSNLQKIKMLSLAGNFVNQKIKINPPKKYNKTYLIIMELIIKKGLSPAGLIGELVKVVKAEINIKDELSIGISEVKMQIKILQFLPFLGIFFGLIIGANPIKTIFLSIFGLMSVVAGLFFIFFGRKWTKKLISSTNLNFNTNLLLSISIIKNCYLGGFSNDDSKNEVEKISQIIDSKLIEILQLTSNYGISPCEMLNDLYNDIIESEKVRVKKKIAEVNAKLMFPLSVCYLPAFILIGLLPIIISMVQNIRV